MGVVRKFLEAVDIVIPTVWEKEAVRLWLQIEGLDAEEGPRVAKAALRYRLMRGSHPTWLAKARGGLARALEAAGRPASSLPDEVSARDARCLVEALEEAGSLPSGSLERTEGLIRAQGIRDAALLSLDPGCVLSAARNAARASRVLDPRLRIKLLIRASEELVECGIRASASAPAAYELARRLAPDRGSPLWRRPAPEDGGFQRPPA